MSTTVGHAICGISCLLGKRRLEPSEESELSWKAIILFAILANVPDLDMVVSYFLTKNPFYYHGQVSHSLLFICVAGFVVMWLASKRHNARLWVLYTSPLLLHVLMDSLTGPEVGLVPSRGVALMWPFVNEPISFPITLMNGPQHDTWERLFNMYNVRVVVIEVLVFTPIMLLAWWKLWRRA